MAREDDEHPAEPGPPPDPSIRLVSVLRTGDAAFIAVLKSVFEHEGIEFLVRGEGVQDLFGWGRVGAGYNIVTGPAEFVVKEGDALRARELIRALQETPPADDDARS